ncbi:MAG: lysophospholipid acyltransferase family protein [Saprospiraceae bacterium]|nr:lysophospholipid acyltransferase family protein [Saprospiraceae bacterium]
MVSIGKLLYVLIVRPVASLPLPFLFFISDILSLALFYSVGYRKQLVKTQLEQAFPEKSAKEIQQIARKFYRHFSDILVESLKLLAISEQEIVERCRITNENILHQYYEKDRSVMILMGHYGNWEFITALAPQMKHQPIALYAPLANPTFDLLIRQSRVRFGLQLIPKAAARTGISEAQKIKHAIIFLTDQCPTSKQTVYWTSFLHQPTAVLIGAEVYARRYNYVVLMGKVKKIKRGYYELDFELITEHPKDLAVGMITEKHTKILEQQIKVAPEFWLWTHRRWKRKRQDYVKNIN